MVTSIKPRDLVELQLFQGEDPAALEWLLGLARERGLSEGEVLLEPGQHNDFLYILIEGSLRIELAAEDRAFVTHIHRGECVGELSVLDGKPTAARVIAAERSRILVIARDELWELIHRSHAVACNLLYLLSSRIRKNDEALSDSFILQQRYARSARVDTLTGLYNRYWLDEMMPRLLERAQTGGGELGLLMLDVDHFKSFNDTHGHLAGDEVLRKLGEIIHAHLRPDDSAIRYGGEEFVILLPDLARDSVIEVAKRLCEVVHTRTTEELRGKNLPGVTVSIGVAMLEPGQEGNALIAVADAALYRAKREGRDRVVV
jgi:diguanylate cyclase (GGDEF)-like protein